MQSVGVVGAGTMGTGVAQTFADAGFEVVLVDIAVDALERARSEIVRNVRLMPLVRPGASAAEPEEVIERIQFSSNLRDLAEAEYLVENVTEKWEVKRPLYLELDRVCRRDAIFGVNTSAIPITLIASLTQRVSQVVGVNFMNPAPLKPTVEVIRGYHTSDETLETTKWLLESVGKSSIVVEDSPGFVTNRVMMLMVNEAIFLLHEGVAGKREIDRLFRECFGHAMGPLETADLIGLDTVLFSLEVLYDRLNDPKYRPCPLLRTMVAAGLHGRKSGEGFFSYD
jgi:3-hydroxybutyryl-CoA dehydrogenase